MKGKRRRGEKDNRKKLKEANFLLPFLSPVSLPLLIYPRLANKNLPSLSNNI